ncbi:hypothetical protein J6590_009171 [Homalodisca vitripennis]|nr:hypothetical protein J6590_009171 [Homalodisca vitripennis]
MSHGHSQDLNLRISNSDPNFNDLDRSAIGTPHIIVHIFRKHTKPLHHLLEPVWKPDTRENIAVDVNTLSVVYDMKATAICRRRQSLRWTDDENKGGYLHRKCGLVLSCYRVVTATPLWLRSVLVPHIRSFQSQSVAKLIYQLRSMATEWCLNTTLNHNEPYYSYASVAT